MGFVVGLTGGIGSGKSKVAGLFEQLGASVVDADAESHRLTGAGGAAIAALQSAFGPELITAQGALDRPRMRQRIYAEPGARARLEAILHPLIRSACAERIQSATGRYVIYMVPLLVESGRARSQVHRIVVVDCREATQIERVMARDGLDREAVLKIIAAQAPRSARLAAADDVIDNDGEARGLEPQVAALHQRYLMLAGSRDWTWPPPDA
jgi:dephospho-CoA kinase